MQLQPAGPKHPDADHHAPEVCAISTYSPSPPLAGPLGSGVGEDSGTSVRGIARPGGGGFAMMGES